MDNSEKLSLFRKGNSDSIGLTDVPLKQNNLFFEPIDKFNNSQNFELNIHNSNEIPLTNVGTFFIGDTNVTNESSSNIDVHTRWSYDSTTRADDIIVTTA